MPDIKTTVFDPAEYIETREDIICFLEAAMEDNDLQHIARCVEIVIRSKDRSL